MTQKGMNSGRESQSLSALLSSFRPHPPPQRLGFPVCEMGWVGPTPGLFLPFMLEP